MEHSDERNVNEQEDGVHLQSSSGKKKWKWGLKAVMAAVLLALSAFLLKSDVWTFWTWWLLAAVMGVAAMPVTGRLFERFDDKGWIFSKMLAITATGYLTWLLVSIKLVPFTALTCVLVTVVCAGGCIFLLQRQSKKGIECFPIEHLSLVYWEELIFFAAFLLWTYLAGFRPEAIGTEKFMDYGFMETMMRSTTLPARDLWYSEGHINYYYGGQYFAVFLTKLSFTKVELTYNLMRTFVAGLAFAMPFSLVYQMAVDRMKGQPKKKRVKEAVPVFAGLTAGMAVSIAGNMHYVIYAVILPWIQKIKGEEVTGYWFPDATRYIGYNPDRPDKTIHEFPCYSFVLGDLHAHVVNIMFVLLLLGLLYAWMRSERKKDIPAEESLKSAEFWKKQLLMPHILLVSLLLGVFQWTNFWDFVIYYVVTGAVVTFTNIIRLRGKIKRILAVTLVQAVEILVVGYVVILPFTVQFVSMVDGVALAQNHTLIHQLLVLWGLPTAISLMFVIAILWEKLRGMEHKSLYRLMKAVRTADLFTIILGLCSIGLVLIPEIVYVKDIYGIDYSRANTMFKLTYQAYIMFGMAMAYAIYRMMVVSRQKIFKILSGIGLFFLVCTAGYFGKSVETWFGEVWKPSEYQGLNATTYLETDFPEDVAAIRWLKKNIKGVQVVLEANGDSYKNYERVSATTGLPTILGWYAHEWLWRGDTDDLNQKSADVESIYTSGDPVLVEKLLDIYEVSYIFVGSMEREKYEDRLNNELLKSLGEIVFADENSGTYIVQVD